MLEVISAFWSEYGGILLTGTRDTLVMVLISTLFAYLLGLPLGVALTVTQPHGIRPSKTVNQILGWIVNIGRSVPFIILMVAIMPFTKLVVGTKIGVKGAIVPLVVSAAPFIARMVETSLAEVDAGVVEAAQSMGASTLQIIWKVYLPEAKPSLVLGGAISIVNRHAQIDKSKCVECGKCAQACSYSAIIRQVRPCISACTQSLPLPTLSFSKPSSTPLIIIALWYRPSAAGVCSSVVTLAPPPDWPNA